MPTKNQDLLLLIGNIDGKVDYIKQHLDDVEKKVGTLPCVRHNGQLNALEEWEKDCKANKNSVGIETYKGNISLRNMILAIVFSSLFTLGVTVVVNYFMIGKP